MRKVLLLLLLCIPLTVGAGTKGLKIVVHDQSGKSIALYGDSHALLIGVSEYQATDWTDLESIPSELVTVEKALIEQGFNVEKHLNPNGKDLKAIFQSFIDNYGYDPENRLLFFFSGHGWTKENGNKGYLVPADAPDPREDQKNFLRKALPMSQVLAWARQTEAKHSLYLFDSCFSGTIFQTKSLPDKPPHITEKTSLPVRQFITAGKASELVPARSTFTPAFVDALKYGFGDLNKDGYVSGTELGLHLQEVVPQHVRQTPQFGKIQQYDLSRGDFIFVLPKASKVAISSPSATTSVDTSAVEIAFWNSIKDSKNLEMFEAYLKKYPAGEFSLLAKIELKAISDKAASSIPDLDYGRYHALVIGNSRYDHLSDLRTSVNNARAVSSVLQQDYGFNVKLLENATRSEMVSSLGQYRKTLSGRDNLLIYYAGHGYLDRDMDEGYWLPIDAVEDSFTNWISNSSIISSVRGMQAKHVMVVADSCFSGTLVRAVKITPRTPGSLQKLVNRKARTALTSGGIEPVTDVGGGQHSVFARALLSLLEQNPGVMNGQELFVALRRKVQLNADQMPEYGDIRKAGHDGGDFLFVRQ